MYRLVRSFSFFVVVLAFVLLVPYVSRAQSHDPSSVDATAVAVTSTESGSCERAAAPGGADHHAELEESGDEAAAPAEGGKRQKLPEGGPAVSPLTPPVFVRPARDVGPQHFDWDGAMRQSLLFLAVQHGYRMTEDKTRRFLPGPFVKDWFGSVKNLHGWDDKGSVFGNYVAHPMQGAVTGFIYVQNSPTAKRLEFENSKAYWKSRAKALGFAALSSTQFELGPISQASIGNVGLGPNHKKMAYVDLVVTPTVGTVWLVMEDAVDRKLVRRIEEKTSNRVARNLARTFLNPMRACANALRFKPLWFRDTR